MDRIRLGERDLVCFLHIPRTGGTSFFEVLASRFPATEVLDGGDRAMLARDLRALPRDEMARYRLLSVHQDTRVDGLLDRTPHFVTMLREPVARVMSYYQFLRRIPRHPLHSLAMGTTFLEFLQHPDGGPPEADRQTRQIAGAVDRAARGAADPPRGAALLELAKERLVDFAFLGLRERFEESVRLLEHTFGWEPEHRIPELNPSGATNHILRLGARELETARELNRLDLELVRFARGIWRERMAGIAPREATRVPVPARA